MENYFTELNQINVNDKTEKKNNLTYLSWAWAWGEVKKLHPDANYTIYENKDGWNYFTDGKTCWVKTGVTINNIEHIEYLPVMDFRNKSISADNVTSFDVNKTIQRSLTKACARHGLGLYIYAGEDLPEGEDKENVEDFKKSAAQEKRAATTAARKGEEKPQPKGTLEERYTKAMAFLKNETPESFKAKPSYVDSINTLLADLNNAGVAGYRDKLLAEFNRVFDMNDGLPDFLQGEPQQDYRV